MDIYKYFGDAGVDGFNLVASIAGFVIAIGILLELGNAAYSYRNGVRVGHDPWGGATLEWFALSPPPAHNFDAVPDVRSAEPLHDIRRAIRDRTESWSPPPARTVTAPAPGEPPPVEAGADGAGDDPAGGGASVA